MRLRREQRTERQSRRMKNRTITPKTVIFPSRIAFLPRLCQPLLGAVLLTACLALPEEGDNSQVPWSHLHWQRRVKESQYLPSGKGREISLTWDEGGG